MHLKSHIHFLYLSIYILRSYIQYIVYFIYSSILKSLKIIENCRNHSNPSAVVNHHELGHSIDFGNSCVIYPESHMSKRKIALSRC